VEVAETLPRFFAEEEKSWESHPSVYLQIRPAQLLMSQADIDSFVESAGWGGRLSPEGVKAAVTRGVPVNGRCKWNGITAMHQAASWRRHQLVVALLEAGADANARDNCGWTPVWSAWCAWSASSICGTLQLLIDAGGSVNNPVSGGVSGPTLLISLMKGTYGDAAARLQMLLACSELDLDARFFGKTAEQWAVEGGDIGAAAAIGEEQERRKRWSVFRATWITATVTLSI
jgi:ankyrin repeat protein